MKRSHACGQMSGRQMGTLIGLTVRSSVTVSPVQLAPGGEEHSADNERGSAVGVRLGVRERECRAPKESVEMRIACSP
jgi:hypothetical protein